MSLNWKLKPDFDFTAWNLGANGEQVYVGDGWGQRDFRNTDLGATLPYIVRRTTGAAPQTFVSLYEGHTPGAALVRGVTRLSAPEDVVALDVATAMGHDYIVSQRAPKAISIVTPTGVISTRGALTIVSVENGKVARTWSENDAPVQFKLN